MILRYAQEKCAVVQISLQYKKKCAEGTFGAKKPTFVPSAQIGRRFDRPMFRTQPARAVSLTLAVRQLPHLQQALHLRRRLL